MRTLLRSSILRIIFSMDVYGASKSSGAKLVQYACLGNLNQQFNLLKKANGYYNIQDQNSLNCVRPINGITASGTKLDLEACNSSYTSEEFQIKSSSATVNTFINHKSGKCIDLLGDSSQSALQLQIYSCNGSAAPIFTVNAPAPAPPPSPSPIPSPSPSPSISPVLGSMVARLQTDGSAMSVARARKIFRKGRL